MLYITKPLRGLQRLGLRTFLSDRYRCEAEWNERLNTPLFLKLKSENLYAELVKKFQNEGKASAIDVDLFSNLVVSESHLDELQEITRKFRRCVNTIYTLPSTGHAVIRTYLQYKHVDMLMKMLDDRLNYGLFLDYYLSNLLMDTFLKENNFRDAAKVSIQLMLQEEFDHPITTHLSLYSCYAYLKNRKPEPWDPLPTPKPEEPVEEVKVRVDYIREPFFDDHFDLVKPEQLIGKTLVGMGRSLSENSHNKNLNLRNLVLFYYRDDFKELRDRLNYQVKKHDTFVALCTTIRCNVRHAVFYCKVVAYKVFFLLILLVTLESAIPECVTAEMENHSYTVRKIFSIRIEIKKEEVDYMKRDQGTERGARSKNFIRETEETYTFFEAVDVDELNAENKLFLRGISTTVILLISLLYRPPYHPPSQRLVYCQEPFPF
nr:EOG090X05Q1 [Ilyocryptus agilis]